MGIEDVRVRGGSPWLMGGTRGVQDGVRLHEAARRRNAHGLR
jgi:hypothetical protein